MSHWCIPDLIAEVSSEDNDADAAEITSLRNQLRDVQKELASVKKCSFPMVTKLKNMQFESRLEYVRALIACADYIQKAIDDLDTVAYFRVNSGQYCGVCRSTCCACY